MPRTAAASRARSSLADVHTNISLFGRGARSVLVTPAMSIALKVPRSWMPFAGRSRHAIVVACAGGNDHICPEHGPSPAAVRRPWHPRAAHANDPADDPLPGPLIRVGCSREHVCRWFAPPNFSVRAFDVPDFSR